MKLFLYFGLIFFLLLVGCTPDLEPNTRISVIGIVLDSNGQGISGQEVTVYSRYSSGNSGLFGNDNFLLGSGRTNSDGSFNLTTLSDRGNDFAVNILGGEIFTDYTNISESESVSPPNSILNIGTVSLKRKAVVDYAITRVSGSGNLLSYSFSYQNPKCTEIYQEGNINLDLSNCFTEIELLGALSDSNPDVYRQLNTTLGSVVTFSYSINEEPMITETFTVDQTNFTYEFTY